MLCDQSLAAAGIGATLAGLQSDRKTLGLLFENLCLKDLAVYAQTAEADLFHYRDEQGLEVDAVLTTKDGRWLPVEIKLGSQQEDAAASALLQLAKKMTGAGQPAASALVAVTGLDSFAHRRDDGVIVVPFDTLGP